MSRDKSSALKAGRGMAKISSDNSRDLADHRVLAKKVSLISPSTSMST